MMNDNTGRHLLLTMTDANDWWQWIMTITYDNDWWASTIIIGFDAEDEIHTIYAKLDYSFYYTSLMVVCC